ncbi:unnamed protein product [Rhodiola kirilowii]
MALLTLIPFASHKDPKHKADHKGSNLKCAATFSEMLKLVSSSIRKSS